VNHGFFRRGRRTSSPPQFEQTCPIAVEHAAQNVHSCAQMNARSAGAIAPPHFSHVAFISSAMPSLTYSPSAARKVIWETA
jgi:hypothetical protein